MSAQPLAAMLWLPELPTFKPLSDMSRKFEHRPHDWSQARRCMVARRRIEETDPQPTLFTLA